MGLFARFACLRKEGGAADLAETVRSLLRERMMVETTDPAAAERLILIASAGDGWLIVVDHLQDLSASIPDPDGLISDLSASHAGTSIDFIIADSDDLMLRLSDHGHAQSQLTLNNRGHLDGNLQPWQRLLKPEQTIDDLRAAFSKRTTFVEAHLDDMEPLFGLDLAAFRIIDTVLAGESPRPSAVLLRFKAVPAPGQPIGHPRLQADENARKTCILNNSFPEIPIGLVGHFPAFTFQSRGGAARGLQIRISGSALDQGLVEVVSAWIRQEHPTDPKLNRQWTLTPDQSSQDVMFRVPDLGVPDWVHLDHQSAMRVNTSLHDIRVFVYVRALKVGDGEVSAEALLLEPRSAPARSSYLVTVLPEMWRPLKGSDQPRSVWSVQALNKPARINGFAVLSGGPDQCVVALRKAIDVWLPWVDPRHIRVSPLGEQSNQAFFYFPYGASKEFILDLGKSRQTKWNRLLADLPSVATLDIGSQRRDTSPQAMDEFPVTRASLGYLAPRQHPRLPEFAARLGHLTVSLPASPTSQAAIVALIEALADGGHVTQAYVADYDGEDTPQGTLYESAADLRGHHAVAHRWGTRYLRAVADRLWLGPNLAALVQDRVALERVAIIRRVGDTLAIERRPDATLRDIEQCLAPLLPTPDDSIAFSERIIGVERDLH